VQRLPVVLALARALAANHDVDAVIAQDALQQAHIGEPRDIVENQRLIGEQARDHQRQGGVLGARDRDCSVEPLAAGDADAIHSPSPHFSGERRRSSANRDAMRKDQARGEVTAS
jgi:hypothetical protein